MNTPCLIIFFLSTALCSAADLRLTEQVSISLPDVPSESLAIDTEAVSKLANDRAGRHITLPNGVQMDIEWGNPLAYCEMVGKLGRIALHTWKTEMEAGSRKTFPINDGWVSSVNVERLGNSATLIIYRFARKVEAEKIQFVTMLDVFGEKILGSITFRWSGVEGDEAESRVAAAIDSISLKD